MVTKQERIIQPILGLVADHPQENESKILYYLKNCKTSGGGFHIIKDKLTNETVGDVGCLMFSDGTWQWDNELIYHIEKYHYNISHELYDHLKKANWKIPNIMKSDKQYELEIRSKKGLPCDWESYWNQ